MWRGDFTSSEANQLHADALDHHVYDDSEWDWVRLCNEHSLGLVTVRIDGCLIGFVNVPWDGSVHAWIQDEMVCWTLGTPGASGWLDFRSYASEGTEDQRTWRADLLLAIGVLEPDLLQGRDRTACRTWRGARPVRGGVGQGVTL